MARKRAVSRRTRITRFVCAAVATVGAGVLDAPSPAVANTDLAVMEWRLKDMLNDVRRHHGVPAIPMAAELRTKARQWSGWLAGTGRLEHCPWLARDASQVHIGWTGAGEAVAVGASSEEVLHAWLNSPPHRDVLLAATNMVGIGVSFNHGRYWFTARTLSAPPVPLAAKPAGL